MKFFEMLADFFMTPVESITEWIDALGEALQASFNVFLQNAMLGITHFVVEGIAVAVISYSMYCAFRVMCSNKDETFSEYINKGMMAALGYYFARYGATAILKYIGG